ncbi:enoyl-CoA hydratase/isomerase family protein [Marinobacter caseinilyticus]|uniref:enoyl-CoA hydratase/isomerase family protein n=1 Tax=Marinobacter caseinilyticus TaxID=2692195 RepID=UPI001409EB4D|nr:enoyl-CoA hydratase/isomerase family protein [Marinobacter caseinilyticus]
MAQLIALEFHDSTVVVTLNRPDALNAVNSQMRDELITQLASLNADPGVRALVLTGAGERAFSAGQDLAEAARFQPEDIESWMQHQGALLSAVRDLDKPIVAAFNGTAAGIGFQLGLLCDVRVGYPEMKLGQPEVRVGLASILGSYLMSLHVGHSHNVNLSLMGNLITGSRGYEIGLISDLVSQEQVLPKAMDIAAEFCRLPPNALRLTKKRFRSLTQASFEEACQAVAAYHLEDYASGEPQQMMGRFLEERAARGQTKEKESSKA